MAEAALVDDDIAKGRKFLALLDKIGVAVKGAFWFYYPDNDRWRLVIVTPEAERGSKELYRRAIDAKADIELARVEFTPPGAPIFRALSRMLRIEGGSEVRLSRNTFDGVYVDDALVYRLAA
jgi:hypothetical protein